MDEPDIRITLRPTPSAEGTPVSRLKRLLKYALRALGLRALKVEELPREQPPAKETDKI